MTRKEIVAFTIIGVLFVASVVSLVNAYLPVLPGGAKAKSVAFLAVIPKKAQVNKPVLVNAWTAPQPPLYAEVDPSLWYMGMAGRPRENYTFIITKPTGAKIEKRNITSYGDGTVWFTLTPDVVGTWKIKFTWPGDEFYLGCEAEVTFTVQTEPVPEWWTPVDLPTGYWQRPITGEFREWNTIAGPWLQAGYNASYMVFDAGGGYNPYTKAPNTAHVVWRKQISLSGLIGGQYGGQSMTIGFGSGPSPPVIMFGRLYYNTPTGFACADLRTGEIIWEREGGSISAGQIEQGMFGAQLVLWNFGSWFGGVTEYIKYDAYTGRETSRITNVPGNIVFPLWDNGVCYIGSPIVGFGQRLEDGWLVKWDSSKVVGGDWTTGVVWNVTLPKYTGPALLVHDGVVVCAKQAARAVGFDAETGDLLWDKYVNNAYAAFVAGYGKFYLYYQEDRVWKAFNIHTGDLVWTSEPTEYPWGCFGPYTPVVAYNKLYWGCYDGHLYAWDVNTGKIAWKFYSGNTTETPYGTWPFWWGPIVADGKVYMGTGEHSPTQPILRGFRLYCIDAYNGKLVWSISGAMAPYAIAEGYLLAANNYDGYLYCFGKGKTSTSVSASSDVVSAGSAVLIKGYVVDSSPASFNTPCVSDGSMTGWMEYLHMQKSMPDDVKGVTVELYAMKANGATTKIGTVTTDPKAGGLYSFSWTPTEEGTYTIMAVFPGSESYWDSCAATAVAVIAAPAPSATAEQAGTLQSLIEALQPTATILTVLVIIAIVIGIVNLYIVIRKRK